MPPGTDEVESGIASEAVRCFGNIRMRRCLVICHIITDYLFLDIQLAIPPVITYGAIYRSGAMACRIIGSGSVVNYFFTRNPPLIHSVLVMPQYGDGRFSDDSLSVRRKFWFAVGDIGRTIPLLLRLSRQGSGADAFHRMGAGGYVDAAVGRSGQTFL